MPAEPTPPPAPSPPAPETDELDPTVRLLFESVESETPPKVEARGKTLTQVLDDPVPEQKEEPKKPEEEKKETPSPEPEKPVKVRRKSARAPEPAAPPPPPPKEEPKEPTAEEKFEAGLLDEERDQLDLARYAEKVDPKYKGYAAKVSKFLKDHQDYLEKNPKATEPNSDEAEAYQTWLAKNNVALPPREMRALEHRRIAESAKAEALKESDSKFDELHDDNFRRDTEPKIKQEADEFFRKLAAEGLPADLAKTVKDEGVAKAQEKFPFEFRVSNEEMTQAAADVEEFRRITTHNPKTGRALKAFDPANKQHERIIGFIREQGEAFKNGRPNESAQEKALRTKMQVNDEGKRFLTRDEYFTLKPDQRGSYWTFSNDQIMSLAHHRAKERIANRIADEFKQRESDGWVRKAAAPPAAPPTPTTGAPPASRPSPIPSGAPEGDEKPDRSMVLLMGE